MSADTLFVRFADLEDVTVVAEMCHHLWPDASTAEHAAEVKPVLSGEFPGALPVVFLVAQHSNAKIVGFIEVGLRSHADGCDPFHPVGFIEGWYVDPLSRRQRVGAQLIAAAEEWARKQGCVEMASDTWIDNIDSQRAHEALGFEVVDRCIHYRKSLPAAASAGRSTLPALVRSPSEPTESSLDSRPHSDAVRHPSIPS